MRFVYDTGIRRKLFHNVRLWGSWDSSGRYSDEWTEVPMKERFCGDGGIVFEAEVSLQASEVAEQASATKARSTVPTARSRLKCRRVASLCFATCRRLSRNELIFDGV